MSEVSEAATVDLLIADYAVADPQGKVNIIGGGVSAIARNAIPGNPAGGLTLPFALYVVIKVPPQLYNSECSVEVLLEDVAGIQVTLPPPAPGLQAQPLRVGQVIRFDEPRLPVPTAAPSRFLRGRWQMVLGFSPGLPLEAGQGYVWRVRIDGESREDWCERFVVVGPPSLPVLG